MALLAHDASHDDSDLQPDIARSAPLPTPCSQHRPTTDTPTPAPCPPPPPPPTPILNDSAGGWGIMLLWLVASLTPKEHASVSQVGSAQTAVRAATLSEVKLLDLTCYLALSQYIDTGPTSPSTDPMTSSPCQGSHWSANFEVTGMTLPRKKPSAQA